MADIVVRASAGVMLALMFYGGLWLTLRALAPARHASLLMAGSFWLRTLVVTAGFFWLAGSRFDYAVSTLVGFVAGRLVVGKLFPFKRLAERCS